MKKIIAILLVAVMALSMAACGGASGDVTYAIVCKDASNPYMLRMISGFEAACEKLGVKSVTKSPETATVDGQIQIVNELIAQGVKGIAIAANDAAALEATIKTATDAGIVVVTLDSDTKGSQMFVNQAGVEQVAQVLVESVYDMAGGEGEFAILSASSTATNQNAWIAAMQEILKDSKYANLKLVETVYGDDEPQKSTDEMQNLMAKYPNLKVVCCPTTVGVLACAQAVQNAGSSIKVAGLGLPSEMNGYVGADLPCPYMFLWNPIEVGETAAYAIQAIIDGLTTGAVDEEFTAANGNTYVVLAADPSVGVQSTQIIVGPPYAFTEENIAEWAQVY